jgi:hypothetical protein
MVPLYVPAARPLMFGWIDSVAGALPLVGVTFSHEALDAAVKDSVPTPWLVTLTDCALGLLPPAVAEKDRLFGLRASTGVVGDRPCPHGPRVGR